MFWTWVVNGFRLASSVLILPVLLRVLTDVDFSVYTQFAALAAIGYTLDGMFATTVARHVGYATRGASDVQSIGLDNQLTVSEQPNNVLLGQLFSATKHLYRIISLVVLVLLGIGGTLVIQRMAPQTSNPDVTWLAWAITIISSCLELYTSYWLVFLRGMNHVLLSARLTAAFYGFKLLLSVALLLVGLGLMAVPISTLVSGLLQRLLARHFMKDALPAEWRMDRSRDRELIGKIWPTSWRMGLVGLSYNVLLIGTGAMITETLGAARLYIYLFSHQVMHNICGSMAAVWTYVKWPLIMQMRVAKDFAGMRELLWPRIWLQNVTFLALAGAAILFGPPLLEIIAPDKELLSRFWLTLLALHALLEINYVFWTTLLTSENRIPSLWTAVATNLMALAVAFVLVKATNLGLGAFVLAPLATGVAFNYWYWPQAGARLLGTNWIRYMFKRREDA